MSNKPKSLRMLYSSNGFWANSGYGIQGRSLLPRLARLPEFGGPEAIAQFAWYGLQGGVHEVNGHRVYPAGNDPYGNDVIGLHAKDFKANVVVSLIDVWVMQDTANKVAPALWLPWTPIDHDPIPQRVLQALQGAYLTLSYSKWGKEMLDKAGISNEYIPHGVEPSIYKILDYDAVTKFRRGFLHFDDEVHMTSMVAANKGYPDRKAFQVQLRAWANFAKDKPEARLYIHTEPTPMYGGLDLPALCMALGIGEKVTFPDRYQNYRGLPPEYLALIYNSSQVLLAASMAEGFGIPIIEAQACGIPVIVTDFSAMPELVHWGYKIPPRDMIWTPMNSWQAWPDHEGITLSLEELYTIWRDKNRSYEMADRVSVSQSVYQLYDWDSTLDGLWTPLIDRLATEAPPLEDVQIDPVTNLAETMVKVTRPRLAALPGAARVQPRGSS